MRKALVALLLAASTLATVGATPSGAVGDTVLVTDPVVTIDTTNRRLTEVGCERGGMCYGLNDDVVRLVDGETAASYRYEDLWADLWCDQACLITGYRIMGMWGDDHPVMGWLQDGAYNGSWAQPQDFAGILDVSCTAVACYFLHWDTVTTYRLDTGRIERWGIPSDDASGGFSWHSIACTDDGNGCVITGVSETPNQVEGRMVTYRDGGGFGPVTTTPRMIVGLECTTMDSCVGVGLRFSNGFLYNTSVVSLDAGEFTVHELPENEETAEGRVGSASLDINPGSDGLACTAGLAECWISGWIWPSEQPALWHVVDGAPEAARTFPEVAFPNSWGSLGCGAEGCLAISKQSDRTVMVRGLSAPAPADSTAPSASISSPVDGVEVLAGASLVADFECVDEPDGSGIASCDATVDGVPVADGAALPTGAPGLHEVVLTATDVAGNVSHASASYAVVAGSVVVEVPAEGGVVTTDPGNVGASPEVPVQTALVVPAGLDQTEPITVEPQPAPPVGDTAPGDIVVFREDERALPCDPAQPGKAVPDPCIESAVADPTPDSDDVLVTVRTAHFSGWSFGVRVAPTAVDDLGFSTFQGQVLVVEAPGVLGNDEVVDSHGSLPPPLVVVDDTSDLHGSVALGEGGGFTYTPDPGFHGTARFTYHVAQGEG
jgi:hypothetical protein